MSCLLGSLPVPGAGLWPGLPCQPSQGPGSPCPPCMRQHESRSCRMWVQCWAGWGGLDGSVSGPLYALQGDTWAQLGICILV